jgi:hypothetical protein
MKKILALGLAFIMLFAFAACGGSGDADNSSVSGDNVAPTSLKFDAESYTVKLGDYYMISDNLTVEPKGAKVVYSVSDTSVASVSKKGEVNGLKSGDVILTVASEDGSVKATCNVSVVGVGTVQAYNEETNDGKGICNKRTGTPQTASDNNAAIIIIPKNLAAGTDMKGAVEFNYGEKNEDGYYYAKYDGYYVAKTNDNCNFKIDDIPEGDYVVLIASGWDYTSLKNYDGIDVEGNLKSSLLKNYFTDAELATMAASERLSKHEFVVKEITVKANEVTYVPHEFAID